MLEASGGGVTTGGGAGQDKGKLTGWKINALLWTDNTKGGENPLKGSPFFP